MKAFGKVFITLLILSLGCSQKSNIVDPPVDNAGSLQMIINKSSVPNEASILTATLSRDGYDNISKTVDLLSTDDIQVLFDNIAIGNWFLTIKVYDASETILYGGEKWIEVKKDVVTPVSITLEPINSGTGGVLISVNWGEQYWNDFVENPILISSGKPYDIKGIAEPIVIKTNGVYKMWHSTASEEGRSYIGYATSSDGISWKHYPTPVLSPGGSDAWDSLNVGPGPVMIINGTYLMYYFGFREKYGTWNIGIATSSDGINWEKYPEPIISGGDGWDNKIAASNIQKIGSKYYLYYTGKSWLYDHKIGLAISDDGINWEKYSDNPILVPDKEWEGYGIYWPTIIRQDSVFKMLYMNSIGGVSGFGRAYSVDGIHWIKSDLNPVFTWRNSTVSHYRIAYPFILEDEQDYKLYYATVSENSPFFSISLAMHKK
jgi:predicted GH43/DUF377 family glycosyl hydrolase